MTVEVLFPEVCGLFGDIQNSVFLEKALPGAQFIRTALVDEPYFVRHDPQMILIGAMTERTQRRVIEKLAPFKDRLSQLVDAGTPILATGNACDIFVNRISYVTEKIETDGLGFFDLTAKTDLFSRYNGAVLGECDGLEIVGFRSQFGFLHGDNSAFPFLTCIRGYGLNPKSRFEGMRRNNLICTQLIGPILPLNPLFCEYFAALAGAQAQVPFRQAAMAAYEQRLKEFRDPKVKLILK